MPSGDRGCSVSKRSARPPRRPTSLLSLLVWSALVGACFLSNVSAATTLFSWGEQSIPRQRLSEEDAWRAIAVGGYHTLALTPNGSVRAWGENYDGQCYVPLEDGFAAIAAGLYHSLALREDDSVVAWGDNTRGQCRPPTTGRFTAVGAGKWHCLAIQSDGALVAWGWNEYGQCDVPCGQRYTALCGGHGHSLALTAEGAVVAWGDNADGQCDVPAGDDFTAIAAGAFHNLALRCDGSLVAWGYNDDGQCDVPKGSDFVAIAAGTVHSLALRLDGSVAAWGHNDDGQCDIPTGCRWAAVMAGGDRSLGIVVDAATDGPFEPYDLASVRAAVARIVSQARSKITPVILSAGESEVATSNGVAAVESTRFQEQTPATSETVVSNGDETEGGDAEVSVSMLECEEAIPAAAIAPAETPIVERPLPLISVSASESVTCVDVEATSRSRPHRSARAAVVVPEAAVARADENAGALVVSLAPTAVAGVSPGVSQVECSPIITGLTVKVPFLVVGCAGAGLVFCLIRTWFRKWREGKRQMKNRQEEIFWSLLIEADQ